MADTGADGESENGQHDKSQHAGMAFQVNIDEDSEGRPLSAPPKRFRNYQRRTITKEELDQKQLEAEIRRKEKEKEMLRRMHQTQDDIARLNRNFSALLEADARLHGAEGTSDTPLSQQELREKFHKVNRDYRKITCSIASSTHCST